LNVQGLGFRVRGAREDLERLDPLVIRAVPLRRDSEHALDLLWGLRLSVQGLGFGV